MLCLKQSTEHMFIKNKVTCFGYIGMKFRPDDGYPFIAETYSLVLDEYMLCLLNHLLYLQCVRKVAVHLQKVLEVMSMSVHTGLNPFNFIRKQFLQIC
jgi:hypothetical protein